MIDDVIIKLINLKIISTFYFKSKNSFYSNSRGPVVVLKLNNLELLKKVSKWFDYVLTCNDELVDNKSFYD